jgi:hypothetical protein
MDASGRRKFLTSIVASLEEELRQIPRRRFNAQKVADREKALAMYRESLSRLDAAEAQSRRP